MTLLELLTSVSNYVAGGVSLSTSTYPTKAQATEWLNLGQRFITTVLPAEKLEHLIVKTSYAYTTDPALTDFGTDILDVISVQIDYGSGVKYARRVTPSEYFASIDNELIGTSDSPIVAIIDEKIRPIPASAGTMYIIYKKIPADMSGDADTPEIGEKYSVALILYAVAQFFKQNDQVQLYLQYMNNFFSYLKGIV